jgi:hypothetical protein
MVELVAKVLERGKFRAVVGEGAASGGGEGKRHGGSGGSAMGSVTAAAGRGGVGRTPEAPAPEEDDEAHDGAACITPCGHGW